MPEQATTRPRIRPQIDRELLRQQMMQLQGVRRMPEPEPEPEPTREEVLKQPPRIDPIFKQMDTVIKDMYSFVPNVNSELIYRSELDKDMKIYGFFMFFGLICILTAVAYSLW